MGNLQKPNALLKSISREDFRDTDILVFRESTWKLIVERKGLKDDEAVPVSDQGIRDEEGLVTTSNGAIGPGTMV